MMGIPITGPTNGFCDSTIVVKNASIPKSTLAKKQNSVAYYKVRVSVAANIIRLTCEVGKYKLPDLLTKFLPA